MVQILQIPYGLLLDSSCLAGARKMTITGGYYWLSGRWFGDLGMMVDGQPAIGSDLEFIPQDYGGYTRDMLRNGLLSRLAWPGGNRRALLYLDGKRRHYLSSL